ncbi:MAG: HD domain-containing phosphohydrolase [Cyanobacteriota bacterium]
MSQNNKENIYTKEGLAKLDFFKYRLVTEMQRSDRQGSSFSVAVIHVETPKIKEIIYPKDILTPHIAKAINDTIRNLDIASIDERNDFIMLLHDTTEKLAVVVIRRIIEKLPFLKSEDVKTKVSVGIANYPGDSRTSDELILAAKYAMFQSQQKGRNEITTISQIRKGLSWEKEANNALSVSRKKFDLVIENTVKSLLFTFATKDEYLEQHSLQVAKIASMLAESVGIKESYVREITLAALLHDVGLLEVPGDVLLKRTPLNHEEISLIKKHPEIATEKILKPIKSFENILPIILDHHENWDGTGYPNQKSERQIHIGARIISIADAYQAMLCNRPYRLALENEEILKTLKDGAGKSWEDKLIASFIDLIQDSQAAKKIHDRRA